MLEQASDLYGRSSLDLQTHHHHQHVLDLNQCADAASEAILSSSSRSFSQAKANCGPNHSSTELNASASSCQNHARPTHQQNTISSDSPLPPLPLVSPPSSTSPLLFPPPQGKLWQRFCWFPIFNWEQVLLQQTSLGAKRASDHSKASSQTSSIDAHGMAAYERDSVEKEPENKRDLEEERSSPQAAGAEKQNHDLLVTNSPPWLPDGWITEIRTRRTGCTAGIRRKVFKHLASGRRFRTQKEVFHFLQTGKGRVTRKCVYKAVRCESATYTPTTQQYASMVGATSNPPARTDQMHRSLGGSLTIPFIWKQLSCTDQPLIVKQKSSTQEAMKVLIENEKVVLSYASSIPEEKESSRLWHWLQNPVKYREAGNLKSYKVDETENVRLCRKTPSSTEVNAGTLNLDRKPELPMETKEPLTPIPIRNNDAPNSRCPTLRLDAPCLQDRPKLQVIATDLGKAEMRAELDKVRGGAQNCAELCTKTERDQMGCAHKSVQGADMSKGSSSPSQRASVQLNELSGAQDLGDDEIESVHRTELKSTQWQHVAGESGATKPISMRVRSSRDHRFCVLNPRLDLTGLKPGLTSRQRAKQVQKMKAKHAKQLLATLGRELCLRLVHQRGFKS